MFMQLLIGSLIICLTVTIEAGFIGAATVGLTRAGHWLVSGRRVLKLMISLIIIVLWMLAALSLAVWLWAGVFILLGEFNNLEPALYFSVVSFTTLGFGDIIIGKNGGCSRALWPQTVSFCLALQPRF